ncbi:hypothetical protein [Limnoglobus roseus]|uniref:Uncharacterized protein n=1 Tax=Limnoglobus roseus TaxID=2598579 RepID=A0A5C1AE07_9BACT|nr:hypothetical protein [Limnoglobus roseus]QEL16256.1 hypothetical protein PX52LOC_03196 [Limnoglobus roseus]
MGWLTKRNRTAYWVAGGAAPVADLDSFKLNGVACGEPADSLSSLGPGEPAVLNEYRFPSQGITLDLGGGLLRAFHVHLHPTDEEQGAGMQPFAGTILRASLVGPLAMRAGGPNLIASLGDPIAVERVEGQVVLTYQERGHEWEIIASPDGRVLTVSVYG